MAEIAELAASFDALIKRLSPEAQKKLGFDIARRLRATQAARIKKNISPNGTAFTPRKPQPKRAGQIKKKLMFQKLNRQKWLKPSFANGKAEVGFNGIASRIATEHQFGLKAKINNRLFTYPKRELLGFTQQEMDMIEETVIKHLAL
ncbi:MAG: phage virion morphogenesis protein [Vibrionaceae bacterium]